MLENNKDVEILKEGPSSVVAFGNELEEVAKNDEKCVIAADFKQDRSEVQILHVSAEG